MGGEIPTQLVYDSSSSRVELLVDVSPAARDDLTVAVGPRHITLRIDSPDGVAERTFAPPADGLRFDGEREAVYVNGILNVSVGTVSESA